MDNYLTPGVYVKEISTLTGIVAEVASAIPAFIGYTGKTRYDGRDLVGVPEAISSFKDFEERFGGAPAVAVDYVSVQTDKSSRFQSVEAVAFAKRFLLYHSVYTFFRNGGGNCFVISTGSYETDKPKSGDFLNALNAAESVDDITLLVMPEAALLEDDGLYGVQQEALAQCSRRMNRFAILDMLEQVKGPDGNNATNLLYWTHSPDADRWKSCIQNFRDKIGINNLSYGAAYTPYIIADVPVTIDYQDIRSKLFKSGRKKEDAPIPLATLDPDAKTTIGALEEAIADQGALESAIEKFRKDIESGSLEEYINSRIDGLFTPPDRVYTDAMDDWAALGGYAATIIPALQPEFKLEEAVDMLAEGASYTAPPAPTDDSFPDVLTETSKDVIREIGALGSDPDKLKKAVDDAVKTTPPPGKLKLTDNDKLAIVMRVLAHRLGPAIAARPMAEIRADIKKMTPEKAREILTGYASDSEKSRKEIRALAGIADSNRFPAATFDSVMRSLAVRPGGKNGGADSGGRLSADLTTYSYDRLKAYLVQNKAEFGFSQTDMDAINGAGDMDALLATLVGIFKGMDEERNRKSAELLLAFMDNVLVAGVDSNVKRLSDGLAGKSPVFKSIVSAVQTGLSVQPPSSAMAGLYAAVDQARGVWKAPANISLAAAKGLTQVITAGMQESLNNDSVAGKSVNAIRSFPGKGLLVWGARTLDGNSQEWRYIPVRRFFIMVEESLKRATTWAVFEPNDSTLWSKIKAMTDNYLLQKWKEGALMGASPAEAFNVGVGLGVTMTEQDILEGRLIVDVGMAVVRPAEFIILRFMHKVEPA